MSYTGLLSVAFAALCLAVGCAPDLGGTGDVGGGDCLSPRTVCGGECVDPRTDALNCGQCGRVCASGEFCSDSQCIHACPSGTRACSGGCVDVSTDRMNCGSCGNRCEDDEICSLGACKCAEGQSRCNGVCTSIVDDRMNCGLCGRECDAEDICTGGQCQCATGTRETDCTDGNDDDCDNLIDCVDPDCNGATRACSDPRCGMGRQACQSGSWGDCIGGSGTTEICGDGIDQNCDGQDLRLRDEYEDNNTCATAHMLMEMDPDLTITATIDSPDDTNDYFKFVVTDSDWPWEQIVAKLRDIPEGHDYDLYLYGSLTTCNSNTALDYSADSGNDDETVSWVEPGGQDDSGTYYVRVRRYAGSSCNLPYHLIINGLR